MTLPTRPPQPGHVSTAASTTHPARGRVVAAFLAPLAYLVWFWVMFAVGYWVTDLFDAYPSVDPGPSLTDQGIGGWLAAVAIGVALAVPSWAGAWLAQSARRRGAGRAAAVALWMNMVMGIALAVATALPS